MKSIESEIAEKLTQIIGLKIDLIKLLVPLVLGEVLKDQAPKGVKKVDIE